MRGPVTRRRLFVTGGMALTAGAGLWLPPVPAARAQSSWDGPFIAASGGVSEGRSLYWEALVTNPNPDAAITGLEVEATFINRGGTVVGTDTEYVSFLTPGATLGLHGIDFAAREEEPGRLDVRVKDFTWRPLGQPGFEDVRYTPGRFSNSVQGIARNPYPYEFADVELDAVCWRGERIVGGGSTYLRRLPGGGTAAVEVTVHVSATPERIDLYAQW